MIESVKITPLYEKCKNLGLNQVTEFGLYIECSIEDADEISNLIDFLQKMTDRRYSIEPGQEDHPSDVAF